MTNTTSTYRPASPKQIAFIGKLCTERAMEIPAGVEEMDLPDASSFIDWLLNQPKPTSKPLANLPEVPSGHYAIESTGKNDLAFYRVDNIDKGKWAGRTFVKLVVGGHPDSRVPFKQVAGILERIANDPDAGPRYGREIGRCWACNKVLTDEVSRATGIGPTCAGRK